MANLCFTLRTNCNSHRPIWMLRILIKAWRIAAIDLAAACAKIGKERNPERGMQRGLHTAYIYVYDLAYAIQFATFTTYEINFAKRL